MATAEIGRYGAVSARSAGVERNRRLLRGWLGIVLFALFALVIVGGATRLTESGLSITEWKPIHGVIPPLSEAEWQEEFELYKRIPEYQQINKGMSLDAFKTIFWWEWSHRLLARLIGVLFALPLAFFWLTGRIERRLKAPLAGLLALGGFQGFIGWWMVSSGLTERTDVSQYRLATHLVIACLIFSGCMWILRGLSPHSPDRAPAPSLRRLAGVLAGLTLFQIYLGALVAGLDAGFSYNTWPLTDGALVPADLFLQQPFWINLFENPKTVQFVHRLGAYTLLALAILHMVQCLRAAASTTHARRSVVFAALVLLQAAIGITTLVLQVPILWGVLHQAFALIVLGFAVAHWRGFYGAYPAQDRTQPA
ncbi:COX15/CtaA family protein [Ensifer soli]|uniref:COX15/CtaA family protein n=1 Tax=Ciceribacter sp. sgz301302 TaxID=3342379 RepID=UPI0035BADC6B